MSDALKKISVVLVVLVIEEYLSGGALWQLLIGFILSLTV